MDAHLHIHTGTVRHDTHATLIPDFPDAMRHRNPMTEQRVQGLQAASHPPVVSSSPGAEGRLQAIQEEFNSPLQGRETFPVQELEVLRWVFTWRGQPSC